MSKNALFMKKFTFNLLFQFGWYSFITNIGHGCICRSYNTFDIGFWKYIIIRNIIIQNGIFMSCFILNAYGKLLSSSSIFVVLESWMSSVGKVHDTYHLLLIQIGWQPLPSNVWRALLSFLRVDHFWAGGMIEKIMTKNISWLLTLHNYMKSTCNRFVVLFLQYDTITIDYILAKSW